MIKRIKKCRDIVEYVFKNLSVEEERPEIYITINPLNVGSPQEWGNFLGANRDFYWWVSTGVCYKNKIVIVLAGIAYEDVYYDLLHELGHVYVNRRKGSSSEQDANSWAEAMDQQINIPEKYLYL